MFEAQNGAIKIELTPEQQKQLQRTTGKQIGQLRLQVEALEERLAPQGVIIGRWRP